MINPFDPRSRSDGAQPTYGGYVFHGVDPSIEPFGVQVSSSSSPFAELAKFVASHSSDYDVVFVDEPPEQSTGPYTTPNFTLPVEMPCGSIEVASAADLERVRADLDAICDAHVKHVERAMERNEKVDALLEIQAKQLAAQAKRMDAQRTMIWLLFVSTLATFFLLYVIAGYVGELRQAAQQ